MSGLPFIYRLKWYALFIIEITETSIYRQWFAILHFKIGLAYIVVIKQTLQYIWRVKHGYEVSYKYIYGLSFDTRWATHIFGESNMDKRWATRYVTSQVLIQDELQVYIRVKLWYRMSYTYIWRVKHGYKVSYKICDESCVDTRSATSLFKE